MKEKDLFTGADEGLRPLDTRLRIEKLLGRLEEIEASTREFLADVARHKTMLREKASGAEYEELMGQLAEAHAEMIEAFSIMKAEIDEELARLAKERGASA